MKKILSLFISIVLIVGSIPSIVLADLSMGIDKNATTVVMPWNDKLVFYYEDDYFRNDSYEYNPSLATMSLGMAVAATSSAGEDVDFVGGASYIKDFFETIGCYATGSNEAYDLKPTTDSIGVCCGAKKIDDFTLIAIAVRGGGYGAEWASNFLMGQSGEHEGFSKSRDIVMDYVDSFITEQGITGEVKFWVSGFSRGAAVANLVGASLDGDNPFSADISYTNEGVYAYCFETPCGTLKSINDAEIELVDGEYTSKYFNIFNITNPNDIVCYVAPTIKDYGFGRYGLDIYMPSAESSPDYFELRNRMLNIYQNVSGMPYMIDTFELKKSTFDLSSMLNGDTSVPTDEDSSDATEGTDSSLGMFGPMGGFAGSSDASSFGSQRIFFKEFMDRFATEFGGGRASYVSNCEEGIRVLFALMLGTTSSESAAFNEALTNTFNGLQPEDYIKIFGPYVYGDQIANFVSRGESVGSERFGELMLEAYKASGITGYSDEEIKSSGKLVLDILAYFLLENPDDFATLAANIGRLAQAHDTDLCYAWLASMDENYFRGVFNHVNNGDYRLIILSGTNNVTVKDSKGNIVVKYDGEPVRLENSAYRYGMDSDWCEKKICLPTNESYTIEIESEGDVSAIIAEYNAFSNKYTRIANYQGDINSLTIPAYYANESTNYSVAGSHTVYKYSGNGMIFANDYQGDKVDKAYADITVEAVSAGSNFGSIIGVDTSSLFGCKATGSGRYMVGEKIKIDAYSTRGYVFESWSENNIVATDAGSSAYYTIGGDATLTAKFKVNVSWNSCSHNTTKAVNFTYPKCGVEGKTSDYVCTSCGEVTNGIATKALEHKYVEDFCIYCQAAAPTYSYKEDITLFDDEATELARILEEERLAAEAEANGGEETTDVEPAETSEVSTDSESDSNDSDSSSKKDTDSNVLTIVLAVAGGIVLVGGAAVASVFAVKSLKKKRDQK